MVDAGMVARGVCVHVRLITDTVYVMLFITSPNYKVATNTSLMTTLVMPLRASVS